MKRFMISNIAKTVYYGVIPVLSAPVTTHTTDERQAMIYTDKQMVIAKEVLASQGKSVRIIPIHKRSLTRIADLTP